MKKTFINTIQNASNYIKMWSISMSKNLGKSKDKWQCRRNICNTSDKRLFFIYIAYFTAHLLKNVYWDKIHIKLAILVPFKYTVQWHEVHSHYCVSTTTICPQNSFLIPNSNSLRIPHNSPFSHPEPWQLPFYFLSLWIWPFWVTSVSRIIQYFSFFLTGLFDSARFILVVAMCLNFLS